MLKYIIINIYIMFIYIIENQILFRLYFLYKVNERRMRENRTNLPSKSMFNLSAGLMRFWEVPANKWPFLIPGL